MTTRPAPASIVDDMPEPPVGRVLPLWLTVVLGVAGTAVAVWGLSNGAGLLGPIVLAFVLTVVAHPMIGALIRRGMRRALAVALAVVLVDGGLIAFAVALSLSFAQLATVLPQYSDEWKQPPRRCPVHPGPARDRPRPGGGRAARRSARSRSSPRSADSSSAFAGSAAALVLVVATALFMTAEAAGLPERLAAAPGSQRLRAALGNFARNTRRYLVVTTIFGFLVAIVDTVAPRHHRRAPAAPVGAAVLPDQLRPEHRVLPRAGTAHAPGTPRRRPRTRAAR